MRTRSFIAFAVAILSSQAYALPVTSAVDTFKRLQACVAEQNLTKCRSDLTARSLPLYDRFTSYGLAKCLPQDSKFISAKRMFEHTVVRASTKVGSETRTMRFVFFDEKEQWKLDIPKSLEIAMGDNWEKQVNATEQIYLVLHQQLGAELNCDAIRALAQRPAH